MIESAWGGKQHAIPPRCLDLFILYLNIYIVMYIDKSPP